MVNERRNDVRSRNRGNWETAGVENNHAEAFNWDKEPKTSYDILLWDSNRGNILRYFYPYDNHHSLAIPFYSSLYRFQKSKNLTERGISTIDFKNSRHY